MVGGLFHLRSMISIYLVIIYRTCAEKFLSDSSASFCTFSTVFSSNRMDFTISPVFMHNHLEQILSCMTKIYNVACILWYFDVVF